VFCGDIQQPLFNFDNQRGINGEIENKTYRWFLSVVACALDPECVQPDEIGHFRSLEEFFKERAQIWINVRCHLSRRGSQGHFGQVTELPEFEIRKWFIVSKLIQQIQPLGGTKRRQSLVKGFEESLVYDRISHFIHRTQGICVANEKDEIGHA